MSHRKHGTYVKYVVEGCRCDPCRTANRDYERNRTRQNAYGNYPYVNAQPARDHVRALMAAGMGLKTVAKVSGVPHGSVAKLIYGEPSRGLAPSKRIRPATERKLLAVQPALEHLAGRALVDATGTRRRLQALVAIGYSQAELGRRIGVLATNFSDLMRRDQIAARTARAVVKVYEQLWDKPVHGHDHRSKIAANRARRMAADRGWLPPMAWDDDTIDDPTNRALVDQVLAGLRMVQPGQLTAAEERVVARGLVQRGQAYLVPRVLRIGAPRARALLDQLAELAAAESEPDQVRSA